MTKQASNNDSLLSLWALEQNFKQTEPEHDHITFLYSGGQDSSTLAWFLYHTEPEQGMLKLVHCMHLMQQDSFFMAQHAVSLSFWLGWNHTTLFPTQALISEKQASRWRASLLNQVDTCTSTRITVNGHTETDRRESAFFQFARTLKNTNYPAVVDCQSANGFQTNNSLVPNHTVEHPETKGSVCARYLTPSAQNTRDTYSDDRTTGANHNPFVGLDLRRPLILLERKDTRTITTLQRLPVYPDQTNFECQATRAQIRYLVFPLLAKLGFGFFA